MDGDDLSDHLACRARRLRSLDGVAYLVEHAAADVVVVVVDGAVRRDPIVFVRVAVGVGEGTDCCPHRFF